MPASPLRLGAADSTTPVGASLLAIFVKKLASKLAPTGGSGIKKALPETGEGLLFNAGV